MSKYLNLGCGGRFHPAWTNVDMAPVDDSVIRHNLRRPLPFAAGTFDAVYHSHVLEHLGQDDAATFVRECYRVLRPGGVVRIAVPNLETIARLYLLTLERALNGDQQARADHHWMLIEMFDQTVRTRSGGNMAAYLRQPALPNESFVLQRMGAEGRSIMGRDTETSATIRHRRKRPIHETIANKARKALRWIREPLLRLLLGNEDQALQVGRFRLAGEIHQWMYDRLSLAELLHEAGFTSAREVSPDDSSIARWRDFNLDVEENGAVRKPDSLYMEAIKP
ncbi:MAG: methyltransferase domain-containing protein [Planctomycetota bacterium]